MALTDPVIVLAGLCKIELPAHTIRLCDGGIIWWGSELYSGDDPIFGTIGAIDQVVEAVSDEAPSGKLTLLPPEVSEAADLFQPNAQGSPMNFWLAEINVATGAIVGTPENLFSGYLDSIMLRAGKTQRTVEIQFMSEAERLFWIKEGNVLSPRFHDLIWPGETGLDQATGVQIAVPWGTSSPSRGTMSVGSTSGAGSVSRAFSALFGAFNG